MGWCMYVGWGNLMGKVCGAECSGCATLSLLLHQVLADVWAAPCAQPQQHATRGCYDACICLHDVDVHPCSNNSSSNAARAAAAVINCPFPTVPAAASFRLATGACLQRSAMPLPLTPGKVFLVLGTPLMVEAGRLAVVHPAFAQVAPVHRIRFPFLPGVLWHWQWRALCGQRAQEGWFAHYPNRCTRPKELQQVGSKAS